MGQKEWGVIKETDGYKIIKIENNVKIYDEFSKKYFIYKLKNNQILYQNNSRENVLKYYYEKKLLENYLYNSDYYIDINNKLKIVNNLNRDIKLHVKTKTLRNILFFNYELINKEFINKMSKQLKLIDDKLIIPANKDDFINFIINLDNFNNINFLYYLNDKQKEIINKKLNNLYNILGSIILIEDLNVIIDNCNLIKQKKLYKNIKNDIKTIILKSLLK